MLNNVVPDGFSKFGCIIFDNDTKLFDSNAQKLASATILVNK